MHSFGEPRPAGAAERALGGALGALSALGAALIVAVLVLVNADSLGRTLFARPILGVIEIVELSLVAIVFLQLGDTVRAGRLTRSDGVLVLLEARRPRLAHALHAAFDLIAAAFMALVLFGAVPRLAESWERGEFKGTAQVFTFPEWPVRLIVVVGAAAALAAFLVRSWRALRRAGGG
jgi:TRAP-type C4-dicarboxylate transport system permease small subunit